MTGFQNRWFALVVALASPATLHAAEAPPSLRPNILWITAEDIWSYDNIPALIEVVRSCVDENAPAPLGWTRQRYLP